MTEPPDELDRFDFDEAFHAALAQLRGEVSAACAAHESWPFRAAAAVGNGFQFAAREPDAAHLLTIEAHQRPAYSAALVDGFADQLRQASADASSSGGATEHALIGALLSLVRRRVVLGRTDALPALAPEAAQFLLMPYLGIATAAAVSAAVAI